MMERSFNSGRSRRPDRRVSPTLLPKRSLPPQRRNPIAICQDSWQSYMLPQCLFTVEAITTTTRTMAKAKKKAAKGKVAHGKRYSDAVKSRVIEFVNQINSEKGRGGISAAAKKFGASPLSISNWVKKGRPTVKAAVAKAGDLLPVCGPLRVRRSGSISSIG